MGKNSHRLGGCLTEMRETKTQARAKRDESRAGRKGRIARGIVCCGAARNAIRVGAVRGLVSLFFFHGFGGHHWGGISNWQDIVTCGQALYL